MNHYKGLRPNATIENHSDAGVYNPTSTLAVDPPKANDYMVGGSHYKSPDAVGMCPHCRMPVEHWDWSFNLRGLEYAATKYIARWRDKGGLESLKKAIHYTQKLINIHFPGVVVHVSYQEQKSNLSVRGGVAPGQGVAQGTASHPTIPGQRLKE